MYQRCWEWSAGFSCCVSWTSLAKQGRQMKKVARWTNKNMAGQTNEKKKKKKKIALQRNISPFLKLCTNKRGNIKSIGNFKKIFLDQKQKVFDSNLYKVQIKVPPTIFNALQCFGKCFFQFLFLFERTILLVNKGI